MHKLFCLIFLPLIIFTLVIYVGNVLLISEKIGQLFGGTTGSIIEITLDVCFIFLPLLIVGWQIKKNLFKFKSYNLDKILSEETSSLELDNFVNNINNGALDHAKNQSMRDQKIEINKYITKSKQKVKTETAQTALLAAVSVVVSPHSFGDSFCMLIWNCRTVNQVLEIYGFRPRGISLITLYFKVLFSSLLVGSIEEVMDNLFPGEKIPLLSPVVQAFAAAYAIFKAAHLTEYYLQHGLEIDHKEARLSACTEARDSLLYLKDNDDFKTKSKEVVEMGFDALTERIKALFKFNLSIVPEQKTQNANNP